MDTLKGDIHIRTASMEACPTSRIRGSLLDIMRPRFLRWLSSIGLALLAALIARSPVMHGGTVGAAVALLAIFASLILGLTHGNPFCFHARNGSGYAFLVKWIKILDEANPQVASRLVTAMNGWQKYTPELAQKMEFSLKEIATWPHLSNDVREIVTKNLEN